MEDYTFKAEQLLLLHQLTKDIPATAYWNFVDVDIQCAHSTTRLYCESEPTMASFGLEEAVVARIKQVPELQIQKDAKLLFENKKIDNIYIVRTLLFFTGVSLKDRTIQRLKKTIRFFMHSNKKPVRSVDDLLSSATWTSTGYVYHPQSPVAKECAKKYSALIDAGIVLQFSNKFLPLFVHMNSWGFDLLEDSTLVTGEQLEKYVGNYYELIKLEKLIAMHAVV